MHSIEPLNGAICATVAILSPLSSLPSPSDPVKIGSRADWHGKPYVELDPVFGWEERKGDAMTLLSKLSVLYDAFRKKWRLSKRVEEVAE